MTVASRPVPSSGASDDLAGELRRLRGAMTATVAAVWVGLYGMYVRVWIQPQDARGNLEAWARPVAEGTAAAPFQYRFLVPELVIWCSDTLGWRAGFTALAVDTIALAAGAFALHALLGRLDLALWSVPAALYGAFLGLGLLWWGKFETLTSFAALTIGLLALTGATPRRALAYLVSGGLLVGTRTDLLVALGLAELARWWWVRRSGSPGHPGLGVALTAGGLLATIALKAHWPDATYDSATGFVQLAHNLQPAAALTAVAFLAPALTPYTLCWRGPRFRALLRPHLGLLVPLMVLVGVEVISVGTIGRVEEVRLFFPLVGALAVVGAIGWNAAWGLTRVGAAGQKAGGTDSNP